MVKINVKIFDEEKDTIVKVLSKFKGKTVAVSAIAKEVGYNPNRTRFIIEDLLQEGRINRIVTKTFNERYIRYTYEVIK